MLITAALLGGAGVGFAFRSALTIITNIAPDQSRGQVTSAFYAISYVGAVVPTVIGGLLTSVFSLFVAATALAAFMTLLTAASAAIIGRT